MNKPTVGQEILVTYSGGEPETVKVCTVGRKYFTASHTPEDDYTHRRFRLSDWNAADYSGVEAFESIEAIAFAREMERVEKERLKTIDSIRKFFDHWSSGPAKLSFEQVKAIETIICSVGT